MSAQSPTKLPARALERVHLGQSFAEYDTSLEHDNIFVQTPALLAASRWDNPHCFFVGRRGTGKTTIARYVQKGTNRSLLIRPELFSPSGSDLDIKEYADAKQKPFRSLTAAFRRSLQTEVLLERMASDHLYERHLSQPLLAEYESFGDLDFDLRAVEHIKAITKPLAANDDAGWLREVKKPKALARDFAQLPDAESRRYTILIDAIDDSWDGSQLAVIYLTALMHAALEVNTQVTGMRVLMFIRENIFERVRATDSEFSRLETCVVGLEWTEPQLLEMLERRFNAPLTAKFPLDGSTWNAFVEGEKSSREAVFNFCQKRPRDVLTYVGLALDAAQGQKHEQIKLEDLQAARRRFSTSRLKDLGDEYQENFPQISLVLSRFYGLGTSWTVHALNGFIERLLIDDQIRLGCASWLYEYTMPEDFSRLLYSIGFLGFQTPSKRAGAKPHPSFRTLGPTDTTPPPVSASTDLIVHYSYWDALDLRDVLVSEFDSDAPFGRQGIQFDFPGALDFEVHQEQLKELLDDLKTMPTGQRHASQFEEAVGSVLELCLFRSLANIEPQVNDSHGTVRRDWVAANRGSGGFWEMVRTRYSATQVVFECKNYEDLKASDFQQVGHYMTKASGKLVFIAFRGEVKNHYYDHIRRLAAEHDGLVVLLNDRDLRVFVRQAINGKVRDDHLQDRYDATVRAIS